MYNFKLLNMRYVKKAYVAISFFTVLLLGANSAALAQSSDQYTLTVTTNGNGFVTQDINQSTYTSGTNVTLTANPAAGQQFTGWSGDTTGTSNPLTITMNANKSVTATFSPIPYSLAISTNGH